MTEIGRYFMKISKSRKHTAGIFFSFFRPFCHSFIYSLRILFCLRVRSLYSNSLFRFFAFYNFVLFSSFFSLCKSWILSNNGKTNNRASVNFSHTDMLCHMMVYQLQENEYPITPSGNIGKRYLAHVMKVFSYV